MVAARRIARDGNHIQPNGADAGHRFQLFKAQRAARGRIDHADVFADGDERAGKAADVATTP